jgi:hypothetical protein
LFQTFTEQVTVAAMQNSTVQNAVAAQAKKSFFSSLGLGDTSSHTAPAVQYDESVIEGKS